MTVLIALQTIIKRLQIYKKIQILLKIRRDQGGKFEISFDEKFIKHFTIEVRYRTSLNDHSAIYEERKRMVYLGAN